MVNIHLNSELQTKWETKRHLTLDMGVYGSGSDCHINPDDIWYFYLFLCTCYAT